MEDYKKNFLDLSEIDRIQQEIERNLYSAPQSDKNYSTDQDKYIKPSISVKDNYFTNPAAPHAQGMRNTAPGNASYHETVKNETTRSRKKKFRRSVTYVIIICTLGTGALGMGMGFGFPYAGNFLTQSISDEKSGNYINTSNQAESQNVPAAVSQTNVSPNDETIIVSSMSDVIKLVAPSVVSIMSVYPSSSDFFSLPYEEGGSGSGIIFAQDSEKVYIATNNHVVSGASSVSVNIEDSDGITAAPVGSDPDADLAVVSISKTDIKKAGIKSVTIAVFGNSDNMRVGDPVIAIGNAMGEGNIVTSGIVSAINKEVTVQNNILTVIQTDAAINPGNSGGPLINRYGEVIGINTAKLSQSGVEGMGYSITSNIAKPIFDGFASQIPKPFLGIQGTDLTKELGDIFNLPGTGVLVRDIVPGSSAQNAGIQRNDVITGFNGEVVFNMKQLSEAIRNCKVGDEVIVKVYRNGAGQMEFKVKLTEYKVNNF